MKLISIYTETPTKFTVGKLSSITLGVNSREGQRYAKLYGISQYPAVIITSDDGSLVQLWQGQMPTEGEVYHYLNSFI